MTFSPDKSPKGNISTERERERREKLVSWSIFHHFVPKKKIQKSDEHRIDPFPDRRCFADVSNEKTTRDNPSLRSVRNSRRIFSKRAHFRASRKICGTGKTGGRNISRRWKKTAKRYISFGNCGVSEARLPRRHLLRSLTSNETKGGDSCPPRATFRDNETYLTNTRAFFNAPTSTN